jgi:amidohydrolase
VFLTNRDISELVDWRHELHANPEVSGEEAETAKAVVAFVGQSGPDRIVTGLGGHGVAMVFDGAEPGPTVLIRSEIDALPIQEISDKPYRSAIPGKAHLCGHEGHTTILAGLARGLGRKRPARGRAVLMFQPAEETGAGAAAVIADPRFAEIAPDYAFSLHNLPGLPLGHVSLRTGPVNCASRGLRIVLTGKTAHASSPQDGVSPMNAVARLMPALTALAKGGELNEDFALVTVTHAEMGEPAFGIAPGRAEIWATLRTMVDSRMAALCARAEALVRTEAVAEGLGVELSYEDVFHHCENDEEAVGHLRRALDDERMPHDEGLPLSASEDFGLFGHKAKSAMFFFGSGEDTPKLHNPDFDFPDDLIEPGARIFMRTVRNLLG